MPPSVSTLKWRLLVTAGFAFGAVVAASGVVHGHLFPAGITGPLTFLIMIRVPLLGLRSADDAIVVRNPFSTKRIPVSTIQSFSIQKLLWTQTLSIETKDGSRTRVTGFPMTWYPIAERDAIVDGLNDWLARFSPDTVPAQVVDEPKTIPSWVVDRSSYKAKRRSFPDWAISATAAGITVMFVALLITAHLVSSGHELTGMVTLAGGSGDLTKGNSCAGAGPDGDIDSGTRVTVTNETGAVIATGVLGPGLATNATTCSFRFRLHLPDANSYSVAIANHPATISTSRQLSAHQWNLVVNL